MSNSSPHKTAISKKRLFKQYLRLVPAKLGLINRAAYELQIDKINSDDIFLVSYPRSGNTWVRFVITYLRAGLQKDITFHDLEYYVPDVYHSKDIIDSQKTNRIIKAHHIYPEHYPRMLYVYRDLRDVLVSFYNYAAAYKSFTGNFSDFIRSEAFVSTFGSWKEHVKAALAFKDHKPDKILMVSYEQLKFDFKATALKIARFCGLSTDIDMGLLEQKTMFEKLKEDENKYGSRFKNNTNKNFMREGKAGAWKDTLSPADLAYIYQDKEVVELLKTLGYETDLPQQA